MQSLWRMETGENLPKENSRKKSVSFTETKEIWDVIVVGAGMAGLLIAYYLQEQGKRVLVLEAKEAASGQTERTTAKITSQHGLKYHKLLQKVGAEKARLYAMANEEAIREYERLIQKQEIACGFERVPAYLYTRRDEAALQEEVKAAAFLGLAAFFTRETELPFPVVGAVCFSNQAQFSPLEFLQAITSKLEIREHTKVLSVRGKQVRTEHTIFTAEQIVLATHYPLLNVPGFYFLRQHQERSYCLALSGCEKIKGMYYGIDQDALSLRQAGDALILGGGSGRTGENSCGGKYMYLEQAAKQYFPNAREITRWAAQDCMPHDGIPFIGKYSVFTPNLYVATGFQKWGMTTSMIAAMLLRDMICGLNNPYEELFTPQRILVRASIGNFLHDVGMSVKGLSGGLFHPSRRCSHMGCELKWNADEESWDCPCHGSRFDKDGKLLDNPTKIDAKLK